LDPNPPEENEADKKKREKAGGEPEIKMINPEPIEMVDENGREFEIQLGRMEQPPIDLVTEPVEDAAEKVPVEGSLETEVPIEEVWVQYAID
jgi:hypothetical protein